MDQVMAAGLFTGLAVLSAVAAIDAKRRGRFSPAVRAAGEVRKAASSDSAKAAWSGGIKLMGPLVLAAYPEDVRLQTQKRLVQAGIEKMDAAEFLALKLTLMFGVAIGAGFLFILIGSSPIWGMLLAGPGYVAPNLWLERRLQERQRAIRKDSVEFAVLMAAVLSAGGVGVNEALRSVGECVSGEIGKEVERTFREISAGQRRSDALEGMADRCGVEEISEIVRCIKTSDRYGVPVAEALRDYASQVYMMRKARAEEQAGKMLIKVIFPMIVFYLLPLFIMLFYPAIIKLGSILAI